MIRNFAPLISLAVFFSGSLAVSIQSVEAKTLHGIARNYFVPPPPPYTPSIIPSELGMLYAQRVTAIADNAALKKSVNPYSRDIFTRNIGDSTQVARLNYSNVGYDPVAEKKILKRIDSIDSEISSYQKEIGQLLDL